MRLVLGGKDEGFTLLLKTQSETQFINSVKLKAYEKKSTELIEIHLLKQIFNSNFESTFDLM